MKELCAKNPVGVTISDMTWHDFSTTRKQYVINNVGLMSNF